MSKTATYSLIASTTISGTSTITFTFSSIPQTFTDLVLICDAKASNGAAIGISPNSATGTFSGTYLYGNGTSAASNRRSNATSSFLYIGYNFNLTSSNGGNCIAHFMDYANTTTYKTVLSRYNVPASGTEAGVSLWQNTAAITSLSIVCNDPYYWLAGTTFKLYGIQAGNA